MLSDDSHRSVDRSLATAIRTPIVGHRHPNLGTLVTVDQTRPPTLQGSVLRWLMSGLVMSGILAMHVLGGHDAGGSEPMAMAPAGHNATATDTTSMDMPGPPSTTPAVSLLAGVQVPVAMPVDTGNGMSDMSCCVLFLITGAALVLLALRVTGGFAARSPSRGMTLTGAMTRRRGPPGAPPPRFSLCAYCGCRGTVTPSQSAGVRQCRPHQPIVSQKVSS